jgi:hypothetical protein
MKPVWRNDTESEDQPQPGCVAIRAKDSLRVEGSFSFIVRHVESVNGKGFMPVTLLFEQPLEIGKVFPGDDPVAYMHAVTRGRRMFERAIKRGETPEATNEPDPDLATQAQKDTIVRLRRTRGFWQKGLSKKRLEDSEVIKLVCQEYYCSWAKLTNKEASKIIDNLNGLQKGFDKSITRSRKRSFTV